MAYTIIGVIGPGDDASEQDLESAYELGAAIADKGWVLLTGGRDAGIMNTASRGAKDKGGITIGVLPGHTREQMSPHIDFPIITGISGARNFINILSSNVVICCGIGAGTSSEISLALKYNRPLILVNPSEATANYLQQFNYRHLFVVDDVQEAIKITTSLL